MKLPLQNIHNAGRRLWLFLRDPAGKLVIKTEDKFDPYYYEPAGPQDQDRQLYDTYDHLKAVKVKMHDPLEIAKYRSEDSYESDLVFPKRFLIDRVSEIEKSFIRWHMVDMEVITDDTSIFQDLREHKQAKKPISCITVYDNLLAKYFQWYLGDYLQDPENYTKEELKAARVKMLTDYCTWTRENSPDLWLAWNAEDFDYPYFYYHINDFPKFISPIRQDRHKRDDISLPAGITIVDMLKWYKKKNPREPKYSLDAVAEKELGHGKVHKDVDFSKLSPIIKARNLEDVEHMVNIEAKCKLIDYFDISRRFSKCYWEDVLWNSKIIDMLALCQAKEDGYVLPRKHYKDEYDKDPDSDEEEVEIKGAYRRAEEGLYFDAQKEDLGGAYPTIAADFCLDPSNIVRNPDTYNEKWPLVNVNGVYFKQNPNALIPKLARKLLVLKEKMKSKLGELTPDTPEYKFQEITYNAFKGLVNSLYGVLGLKCFRLFSLEVANSITFLIRDLLHYTEEHMLLRGYKVFYLDTDSVFILTKDSVTKLLNELITSWAGDNYNTTVTVEFDHEGVFEDLLILGKCRYIGHIMTKRGLKEEAKGVETKRADSTLYIKEFQKELFRQILGRKQFEGSDGQWRRSIMDWIKQEIRTFGEKDLRTIGFPCKISRKLDDYKALPIFVRALGYTQERIPFKKKMGENFYWIYVKPFGRETKTEMELRWRGPVGQDKKLTPGQLRKLCKELTAQEIDMKTAQKSLPIVHRLLDAATDAHAQEQAKLLGSFTPQGKELAAKLIACPALYFMPVEKPGKVKDVLAFDDERTAHVKQVGIDLETMLERNVFNKVKVIFEALKWETDYQELISFAKTCQLQ